MGNNYAVNEWLSKIWTSLILDWPFYFIMANFIVLADLGHLKLMLFMLMESALQIHLTKSYISERPQYMILSTELPHAKTGTDFGSFESKPSVLEVKKA